MALKRLIVILLLLGFSGCRYFDSGESVSVSFPEFRSEIERVDCDNSDRLLETKKLFKLVGGRDAEIQSGDGVENVVLSLKGESEDTIFVGAHYDKTTLGCGAIDNWTGVVIVANLYKSLANERNKKSYKFVAFGKEERGLLGSKAFVESISKDERSKQCAMVNFDSFGFSDLWALESISDNKLIDLGREIAKRRRVQFSIKNFKGASSDSRPFRDVGIPAITLSGLNDSWKDYLHKDGDQLKNLDAEKVYQNYLFALDYLREIDGRGCDSFE